MAADDYSPWTVDDRGNFIVQFNHRDGSALAIGSATLSIVFVVEGVRRDGTGVWTVIGDGSAGQAFYAPSVIDVGTAGDGVLQANANIGGKDHHTDEKTIQFVNPL